MDVNVKLCHICQTAGNSEQLEELETLLPSGFSHLICVNENNRVQLKVRMSTREEVDKWLEDFQYSSGSGWRKARTYPESGRYNVYRVDLRCQHKIYGSGKRSVNTECPATLTLVLKRSVENRRSRASDRHMFEGFLLYVSLRIDHNHPFIFMNAPVPDVAADEEFCEQEETVCTSDAGPIEDSDDTVSLEGLETQLDNIFGHLKRKLREDMRFIQPIQSFIGSFEELGTDGAVQAALSKFGKRAKRRQTSARPADLQESSSAAAVQQSNPAATLERKRPPKNSQRDGRKYRIKSALQSLSFNVERDESAPLAEHW